jgi:hypothetical protein
MPRRRADPTLVWRIANTLKASLHRSLGVNALITQENPLDPAVEGWVTAEARIDFEFKKWLVEIYICTPLGPEGEVRWSRLLETGGPGATVYNFDLAARLRDAVKEALRRSAFDVDLIDADDEVSTGDQEEGSAMAQFRCEIAGRTVGIVISAPIPR